MTDGSRSSRRKRPARAELVCPLCRGPNGCAGAAALDAGARCWCMDAPIDPVVLARVPHELRGTRCVCAPRAGPTAAGIRRMP